MSTSHSSTETLSQQEVPPALTKLHVVLCTEANCELRFLEGRTWSRWFHLENDEKHIEQQYPGFSLEQLKNTEAPIIELPNGDVIFIFTT
jgi:hypothetical protein